MKQHRRCIRILMWIFKIWRMRLRAGFMWSMIRFQVLVNTVMNLRFPLNVGNLISRCAFIISKGLRSAESEFPNNCMFYWSVHSKQISEVLISSKIFLFLYFQGNVRSIIKCRVVSKSLWTAVNYLCVPCYHKYRLSTYIAPGWPWIHPLYGCTSGSKSASKLLTITQSWKNKLTHSLLGRSIASLSQEANVIAAFVFNKGWHSIR
jgi:hypothetical protein